MLNSKEKLLLRQNCALAYIPGTEQFKQVFNDTVPVPNRINRAVEMYDSGLHIRIGFYDYDCINWLEFRFDKEPADPETLRDVLYWSSDDEGYKYSASDAKKLLNAYKQYVLPHVEADGCYLEICIKH